MASNGLLKPGIARVIGLATLALIAALGLSSLSSAFNPGSSPYNASDAVPSCAPSPLPAPGGASVTAACVSPEGPASVTWIPDNVSGSTDNAWVQGTSSDCFKAKAGSDPAACVTLGTGSVPPKNELEQLGVGLSKGTADDDRYLYAGINRASAGGISSSNANYNVEINQLNPAYEPAAPICAEGFSGPCNRWRSPNDMVLMIDWGGNTASCSTQALTVNTPAICIYRWIDTSGPDANSGTCFNAKAPPCWGNVVPLGIGTPNAAGSISSNSRFSEVGVNLSSTGLVEAGECVVFHQVVASARASSSFTAEEKDVIIGDAELSTCSESATELHEVTDSGGETDVTPANNGLEISVFAGAWVKDVAFITNGSSVNDGNVTFRYYESFEACDEDSTATSGTLVSTNPVSAGVAESDAVQFTTPGEFYWKAFFDGGANLDPSASPCNEILTVNKGQPDLSTAPKVKVVNNDTATLSDLIGASPGGTLDFSLYQDDATCSGTPIYTEEVNVTGDGNYSTSNTTEVEVTADTAFYWKVVYSGDVANFGSTSDCVESVDIQITTDP